MVRISSLLNLARDSPVLLLNSDIHIEAKDFMARWLDAPENELRIGIRWDIYWKFQRKKKRVFKWGIDAFLITPILSRLFPDIGMTMGCPVWDYWMVWYAHSKGYEIKTDKDKGLWHEWHQQNWSKEQYKIGFQIVQEEHGITERYLTDFIQDVTKRRHLKR